MSVFASDRLRQAIEAVVRALVPPLDPLVLYEGTIGSWDVASQTGIVNITHPAMPPALARVPLRIDPPGTRVNVAPGTSCLLGFANGDPSRPEVRALNISGTGAPIRLDIAQGTAAAARVGDGVSCGVLRGICVGTTVLFSLDGHAPTDEVHLNGQITSGSSIVRIG